MKALNVSLNKTGCQSYISGAMLGQTDMVSPTVTFCEFEIGLRLHYLTTTELVIDGSDNFQDQSC